MRWENIARSGTTRLLSSEVYCQLKSGTYISKGTLTPLLGVGACVSIQFGVVGAVKRYFAEKNGPEVKQLKTSQLYTAGMTAGIANSIVAGMCVLAFYHLIDASALYRACGTYSYSTSSATRENLLGSIRLRGQVSTVEGSKFL